MALLARDDLPVVDDYSGGPVGLPCEGDVVASLADLHGLSGLEVRDRSAGCLEVLCGECDLFGGGHVVRLDWPGTRLVEVRVETGVNEALTVEDMASRGYRHVSRGVSRTLSLRRGD